MIEIITRENDNDQTVIVGFFEDGTMKETRYMLTKSGKLSKWVPEKDYECRASTKGRWKIL